MPSATPNRLRGTTPPPLVSVLIPAYNEGATLARALKRVHATLCELAPKYRSEIVLVDDGSSDDTWDVARHFGSSHAGVRVVRHSVNLGLGAALRTGIAECAGDYLVVLDADLSYSPDHIPRLLEVLVETRAQIAVASPYMKGGRISKVPMVRAHLSRLANHFLTFLCPRANVHTLTSMVRAYDGDFLRSLNLRGLGVEVNTEILYKALLLRGRIVEVPAHLDWSLQSASGAVRSSSFRAMQSIASYLLAGFFLRPFVFFLLPGILLGLVSVYIIGWIVINVASAYGISPAGSYFDDQFSSAVALVFRERPHAFFVGGATLLASLQLLSLGILSYQNKRYFEELFHLNSETRRRVVVPHSSSNVVECEDDSAPAGFRPGAARREED